MFYTINSSPLLVTKCIFMLTIILSNYQQCPVDLMTANLLIELIGQITLLLSIIQRVFQVVLGSSDFSFAERTSLKEISSSSGSLTAKKSQVKSSKSFFLSFFFKVQCRINPVYEGMLQRSSFHTFCKCEVSFDATGQFSQRIFSQELSTFQLLRIIFLQICDVKIHIAFAFAGGMNRACLLAHWQCHNDMLHWQLLHGHLCHIVNTTTTRDTVSTPW